ncbi:Rv2175c family DNA-binding protein [Arenivirga flava]|uniref:Transcriptional regulator n=1 Tax=Arenivirga flava TaxID=1930060 RepID=A0AA37XA12_9MICO|nr:Rv2175c family DNA-binding protein [Arenivirga flava]GMA27298.1 transcriptional regulator [Arenivirga flava]
MTENAAAWLTVPDLVEELGLGVGQIHRLLEDRALLAVRRDGVLVVPAEFIRDGEPVVGLAGTITLLADSGYSDDEAMRWLLAEEESLGRTPIASLRDGHKSAVRRAAQSLAF